MRIAAVLLSIFVAAVAIAEDVRTVSREAVAAYHSKDWPLYLENVRKLNRLRPNHPRVLYNLSGALALNGESDEALETLSRVASMGVTYPASQDDDFAGVRKDPRFEAILEQFDRNAEETGTAEVAFTIEEAKGAIPEGLAVDPEKGDVFVGLVRDRAIWRVANDGTVSRLVGDDPDVWSVMGMSFDQTSRTLWFCQAATSIMKETDEDAVGRAAVVAIDPDGAEPTRRFEIEPDGSPHWLGDLTLGPKGTVYATDSQTPAIYRIGKGSERIELWLNDERFVSLQGLVWSDARQRLFVADYVRGIWSIDPVSGRVDLLETPDNATVLGIDGLYEHAGDLIGIQNGTRPHRIIRMRLNDAGRSIDRVEVLEANHAEFDEPTLGFVDDGWLWFVATSQWGSFSDDGVLNDGAIEKPVVVMKRRL